MANLSPTGIYYHTAANAPVTEEARSLALATSIDKAVGLVPIIPTSVSVTSGTATVDANGKITLNNAVMPGINGCFTSAFLNYKVIMSIYLASGGDSNNPMRFRYNGSALSANSYIYGGYYAVSASTLAAQNSTGATTFEGGIINASVLTGISMDIYYPATANNTAFTLHSGSSGYQESISGVYNVGTAVDGLGFTVSTALYGTIQVYGYR